MALKCILFLFFFYTSFNCQAGFPEDEVTMTISLLSLLQFSKLVPIHCLTGASQNPALRVVHLTTSQRAPRRQGGGPEALPRNESSGTGSQTPSSSLNPLSLLWEAEGAQIKTKQLDCRKGSIDCLGLSWGWEVNNKDAIFVDSKCEFSLFFYLIQELCCFKRPFLLIQNEEIPSDGHAISGASVLISSVPWHCLCSQGSERKDAPASELIPLLPWALEREKGGGRGTGKLKKWGEWGWRN